MNDVYNSPEFQEIHTLARRVGKNRHTEEHPYQQVISSLRSLSSPPSRRRLRFIPHPHGLRRVGS